VAVVRVGVGLAAVTLPALATRPWIGGEADESVSAVLGRALGGRDIALGLGTLSSVGDDESFRSWVIASALADTVDALTTIFAFSRLPRIGRWAVLASAGGAAAVGASAALLL
jgi:hypothetical protein